ncbi:MAG: Asp-tRNA(Asn)/Glu-tRNA(Gln) amidotransferase subunit GatC [Holosporales bacterium]|nr:Asp-tRNA(Asn)/Glu-tRNA(Gln) amidotransferase subunit GatC [Holosporales bacterium]
MISNKTVKSVARLAKIRIADDEIPYIASELEGIMSWIDQLQSVDVSDIQLNNDSPSMPEREDRVTERNVCMKILDNVPDVVDQWIAVPKMIKS